MLRLKVAISTCIIVSALLQTVMAQAATYYVGTTGSDGNPGTSSKPWRTVAHAARTMIAGDTTYVRAGTYREGLIQFVRSGTSSSPIKLLNAPGEFPVIDCLNRAQYHRILLSNGAGYQKPIGWITIEGFEIRNCYNGIKVDNGHDLTIRRNWIHHNTPGSGIFGNGTRILIDRNRINSNAKTASYPPGGHGIYANGTAFTVTNNLFYDNLTTGVQLNGTVSYKSTHHAGPEFALSRNWVIDNNTFAYQTYGPGTILWGSECDNARVENNIFYENSVKGSTSSTNGIVFTSMSSTGIVIRNNLVYASGSGGMSFFNAGAREGVNYTQSGNIVNTTNPRFVNAPATLIASPNFALSSQSSAINKGKATTAKLAFNAVTRPQGSAYDIGAYEYYPGGSTAQMLLAPTSARAF